MTNRTPSLLAAKFAALCALIALFPLSVCASDAGGNSFAAAEDEQASNDQQAGTHMMHRLRDPDFAYFTIAPDPRLCPSPLCGGYWVTRVNRPLTVCADGSQAPRCYVATLDLSLAGLAPEQEATVRGATGHLLMRGFIRSKESPPFGNLGVFGGLEAWIGHAKVVATGTFYRARSTGIVCIAYPCPTVKIALLDQEKPAQRIAGVDLRAVSADPADGYTQLYTPEGLVAAGDLVPVSGPAGSSSELVSSEYYLTVKPEPRLCGARGSPACGQGEFCDHAQEADCGRADQPGVCEVRPAACTLNYDPVCGCDERTYSNACAANAAGVSVDHRGPCP